MSAPAYYDSSPPPYYLGDTTPTDIKSISLTASSSTGTSKPAQNGRFPTSLQDKAPNGTTVTSPETPDVVADGEARDNVVDAADVLPPTRTSLMTATATWTSADGHRHEFVRLWEEQDHVYMDKGTGNGLYDESDNSSTTSTTTCIDNLLILPMKDEYHVSPASHTIAEPNVTRLRGRDGGPDMLSFDPLNAASSVEDDNREIRNLQRIEGHSHPNVVRYFGVDQCGKHVVGMRVSVSGMTLEETLASAPFMDLGRVERDVYAGIEYLHSRGMQHNNIGLSAVRICGERGLATVTDLRYATVGDIVLASSGGGIKGWLRRRRDPDYTAARRMIRQANALRLYHIGRHVYCYAYWPVHDAITKSACLVRAIVHNALNGTRTSGARLAAVLHTRI